MTNQRHQCKECGGVRGVNSNTFRDGSVVVTCLDCGRPDARPNDPTNDATFAIYGTKEQRTCKKS